MGWTSWWTGHRVALVECFFLCLTGVLTSLIGGVVCLLWLIWDAIVPLVRKTKGNPQSPAKKALSEPKSIVITGASRGIGKALALHYARSIPGVHLALLGRSEALLNEVASECTALGATTEVVLVSVTDEAEMTKAVRAIDRRHPIDLVIANAGVSGTQIDPTRERPVAERIRGVFDTNVNGVLNSILPVITPMILRRRGHLAIVSSLGSFAIPTMSGPYAATKACMTTLGLHLRSVLEGEGVRVSVVCPGFIATDMLRNPTTKQIDKLPFMMTAEDCAQRIANGLSRNQPIIAFPLPMYMLVWLGNCLPSPLKENLLMSLAPAHWQMAFD